MKITFGMPELLVLFSLFIYSHSFWFSVSSFLLGIGARFCAYLFDRQNDQEKRDALIKFAENFISALPVASVSLGEKVDSRFH